MALLCKHFLCTARPTFGKTSSSLKKRWALLGWTTLGGTPKIVIRGKTLGKNLQNNIDYYVSSQPAPFC